MMKLGGQLARVRVHWHHAYTGMMKLGGALARVRVNTALARCCDGTYTALARCRDGIITIS